MYYIYLYNGLDLKIQEMCHLATLKKNRILEYVRTSLVATVHESPRCNARDTGLIPGLGRLHLPQSK